MDVHWLKKQLQNVDINNLVESAQMRQGFSQLAGFLVGTC